MSTLSEAEANGIVEIDIADTENVSGAGWGGAMFGAYMGAEFGPVGMAVGALAGHMMLD